MVERTCSVGGCDRPHSCKGYCAAHYTRSRRSKPLDRPINGGVGGNCAALGCDRQAARLMLCDTHYMQQRRTGELRPIRKTPAPAGSGHLDKKGYRILKIAGRDRPEHHLVMEQVLGRSLYPFENVHHKNGRRADNRPENLELWTKPQPAGQRPEDLVAWVVEFYPDLVAAALASSEAGTSEDVRYPSPEAGSDA